MSPTVFRYKNYRFYFFSREEQRLHIHVLGPGGEAKFWIDPKVELAQNFGISSKEISELTEIIKSHESEIRKAWKTHF